MSNTKRPTIEELERILASNEKAEIRINPDGSIFVNRELDAKDARIHQLEEALKECVAALGSDMCLCDVPEHCQDDEWYKDREHLNDALTKAKALL